MRSDSRFFPSHGSHPRFSSCALLALLALADAAESAPIVHTSITGTAYADGVSYSGGFTQDDEYQVIAFSLGGPSAVDFTSFGADGGGNGAGTSIAAGGFIPVVSVFAGGNGRTDDFQTLASHAGGSGGGNDVAFRLILEAGLYYAVVAVYDNADPGTLPQHLVAASPYTDDYLQYNSVLEIGIDNFTYWNWGDGSGDSPFWTPDSTERGGGWALDIASGPVPVPEPGTAALAALGLAALWRARPGHKA